MTGVTPLWGGGGVCCTRAGTRGVFRIDPRHAVWLGEVQATPASRPHPPTPSPLRSDWPLACRLGHKDGQHAPAPFTRAHPPGTTLFECYTRRGALFPHRICAHIHHMQAGPQEAGGPARRLPSPALQPSCLGHPRSHLHTWVHTRLWTPTRVRRLGHKEQEDQHAPAPFTRARQAFPYFV